MKMHRESRQADGRLGLRNTYYPKCTVHGSALFVCGGGGGDGGGAIVADQKQGEGE